MYVCTRPVCMYVCMYVYMYVHVCMYVCMHVFMHNYVCVCMYVYVSHFHTLDQRSCSGYSKFCVFSRAIYKMKLQLHLDSDYIGVDAKIDCGD